MAYDAAYNAHSLMVSLAEDVFPAELVKVCAERSVRVDSPRKVYDNLIPVNTLSNAIVPCIEVGLPDFDVEVAGDSPSTVMEFWIVADVKASNSSDTLMAYLTALTRTYMYGEAGAGDDELTYELAGASTSPPLPIEGANIQSVGVKVLVTCV